ncbi:MAG: GNAT family N-acetyltransferase [Beijerinckiaceae bacterium]|jgi:GNAT superfamily N-acetyltransferase|nr:GNAT family N-acetyltransferase [Beijerinckiaceae bacterium]
MATVQVDTRFDEVHKAVLDGLVAYNTALLGDGGRQPVAVSVRDGEAIVGGAVGRYWHGWVYVDLFWVSEALRGQQIGTRVMDALEAHALDLGARGVHLTTYSWQARPFYERRGYAVFGSLSPYPEGHACYWLSKTLTGQDAAE